MLILDETDGRGMMNLVVVVVVVEMMVTVMVGLSYYVTHITLLHYITYIVACSRYQCLIHCFSMYVVQIM